MFLRRYILLLLTLLSFTLQAQQYPVDVQVFVTPPYPQSLRGYADTFEQKIQAHFLLKDLSTGGRPFVLRFSLEDFQGQVIAQTPDYITPYLVNLSPGVRRTLTNIDFKTLLRYENLYGINEATYNGLLPEGTYFIGLSLYDVATGRPVSNKGRAMIQVRRYSPPVLTMPQKGEVLTKKNAFQHIVFQWMPRDVAPFMQYEFTLKEVWDLALVPEEAFMTGRLVYQTKTFSPALAYTNMMPILLENKRYVWQVRAFTNNPNNPNEQSYFKNNGNSETFYFDLVSHCEAPKFLTAITESTSAQLRWSAQAMMPNQEYPYKVMYREKGKTWKSQKVSMPYAKLTNLKRGRTYIYKVGVACGLNAANSTSVFGEESYMYSTEQEFTTTEQIDEKSQVQCGVKPEIRIKNTNPLQDNLYPNTTFTAGDFPVTVLNATGNNGVYSGEGYVKVPYLQDTKIKVVFNGIKLNTERQLIEGKLVTTYDETESNVINITNEVEKIKSILREYKGKKNQQKELKEQVKQIKEEIDKHNDNELKKSLENLEKSADNLIEKGKNFTSNEVKKVEEEIKLLQEELQKYTEKLNSFENTGGSINNVGKDSYFDGVINGTTIPQGAILTENAFQKEFKSKQTIAVPNNASFEIYTINNQFKIIVSTSNIKDEEFEKLKKELEKTQGFTIWLHYTKGENQLKYKINYSDRFFSKKQDIEIYKRVMKKMLENADPTDNWGQLVIESAYGINTMTQKLINTPQDYQEKEGQSLEIRLLEKYYDYLYKKKKNNEFKQDIITLSATNQDALLEPTFQGGTVDKSWLETILPKDKIEETFKIVNKVLEVVNANRDRVGVGLEISGGIEANSGIKLEGGGIFGNVTFLGGKNAGYVYSYKGGEFGVGAISAVGAGVNRSKSHFVTWNHGRRAQEYFDGSYTYKRVEAGASSGSITAGVDISAGTSGTKAEGTDWNVFSIGNNVGIGAGVSTVITGSVTYGQGEVHFINKETFDTPKNNWEKIKSFIKIMVIELW